MKDEYMKMLESQLTKFSKETRNEILEDYEAHFAEGRAAGLSDEEIIRDLGDIQEMIAEIPEEDVYVEQKENAVVAPFENASYDGTFSRMVIETEQIDMEIEMSDDNMIHVDYQGEDDIFEDGESGVKFYQYEKDGVFYAGIKERPRSETRKSTIFGIFKTNISFNSLKTSGKLIVRIPEGFPEAGFVTLSGDYDIRDINVRNISVKTRSGDIDIENVTSDALAACSTSGDIEAENINADTLCLTSTSGDIKFIDIHCDKGVFNSISGDIEGSDVAANEIASNSKSGDISVEAECRKYIATTASGDVEAGILSVFESANLSSMSGDIELELCEEINPDINAKTISGDVLVDRNGRRNCGNNVCIQGTDNAAVEVKSCSGDIEIR